MNTDPDISTGKELLMTYPASRRRSEVDPPSLRKALRSEESEWLLAAAPDEEKAPSSTRTFILQTSRRSPVSGSRCWSPMATLRNPTDLSIHSETMI